MTEPFMIKKPAGNLGHISVGGMIVFEDKSTGTITSIRSIKEKGNDVIITGRFKPHKDC